MPSCFKTYDVRGRLPDELNPDIAQKIGRAYARVTGAKRVVVGRDMRLSSPEISAALSKGLMEEGVEVLDLGLCGTENVYFATFHQGLDGGVMVTASHNPKDYNGMKLVGAKAVPISQEQLRQIEADLEQPPASTDLGAQGSLDVWDDYLRLLGELVPADSLQPMKIVCDGGNGAIGPLLEKLDKHYPSLELVIVNGQPDGTFPNGVPNPLLPEKREGTSRAVKEHGAQMGVAWDGDYDRCFFYDELGNFVESYYLIALLAEFFLEREPGATILYDPRLTWNTVRQVTRLGGEPLLCRTGHVFFKQMMASSGAVYGGEMSGHHYFRDFGNCDSGVVPFLLMIKLLQSRSVPLSRLVADAKAENPISGEINRSVSDANASIARARGRFAKDAVKEETVDGLSLEFADWRFNLRSSNTEPLLRLNVEARDPKVLSERTAELLELI